MPAVSDKQRKAMAIALHNPGKLLPRNRSLLSMSKEQLKEFASGKLKKPLSPKR